MVDAVKSKDVKTLILTLPKLKSKQLDKNILISFIEKNKYIK